MIRSKSMKMLASMMAIVMVVSALFAIVPPVKTNAANLTITIDPGHGGSDPGNTSASAWGGASEAEHTWSLSNHVKTRLEQYGITVYFTRGKNENPSLSARAVTAGNYGSDLFLSIHTNSYSSSSANGVEILIPNTNYRPAIGTASRAAATIVLNKLIAATGLNSRGLLLKNGSGTYADGSATDYYGIIRHGKLQNIPVVMLVETGFASNQGDYNKALATDAIRQNAAYAIADGIAQYYGLSLIPTGPSVLQSHNDTLTYLDDNGNVIGQAYEPGGYGSWGKFLAITKEEVSTIVDWGWAAFGNASTYQYGYIINGVHKFSDSFMSATDGDVTAAIASLGNGAIGSRYRGTIDTSTLNPGNNNVQFCVKLDGSSIHVLREYVVTVEEYVEPDADGSYATFDFTNKTWAEIQAMFRVEEHSGMIGNDVSVSVVDGVARFTATGADPYAVFLNKDGNGTDTLGTTGKQARYILVKYKTSANSQATPKVAFHTNLEVGIQWGHIESYTMKEIISDGTWNYVLVDTYNSFGKWNSNMQAFRMDFLDVATAGEYIDVANVKFFSKESAVQNYLVAEMNAGNTTAHEFLAANYPSLSPTPPPAEDDDNITTPPGEDETETTPPEVEVLVGDLNGDGLINTKDLTRMHKYLSTSDDTLLASVEAADVNVDGVVNAKDITRIKKYLSSGGDGSITLG